VSFFRVINELCESALYHILHFIGLFLNIVYYVPGRRYLSSREIASAVHRSFCVHLFAVAFILNNLAVVHESSIFLTVSITFGTRSVGAVWSCLRWLASLSFMQCLHVPTPGERRPFFGSGLAFSCTDWSVLIPLLFML